MTRTWRERAIPRVLALLTCLCLSTGAGCGKEQLNDCGDAGALDDSCAGDRDCLDGLICYAEVITDCFEGRCREYGTECNSQNENTNCEPEHHCHLGYCTAPEG